MVRDRGAQERKNELNIVKQMAKSVKWTTSGDNIQGKSQGTIVCVKVCEGIIWNKKALRIP